MTYVSILRWLVSATGYSGRYRFSGAYSLCSFGGLLYEKEYKIMNTELGIKVNIYLGSLPGPWKVSMQVRCPETQSSLASIIIQHLTLPFKLFKLMNNQV